MHIGSLKKRMIKLSKRLHRSIDGSPQGNKLEELVNEFESTVDDAHRSLSDGRGKANKILDKSLAEKAEKPKRENPSATSTSGEHHTKAD